MVKVEKRNTIVKRGQTVKSRKFIKSKEGFGLEFGD